MPPTYTTLATWHIPLVDFLEGEYEFRSVFTQGGVEVASTIKSLDIGKVKYCILISNWQFITNACLYKTQVVKVG